MDGLQTIGQVLLSVALIAVVLGALVMFVAYRKLRALRVPPGADFWTTMRYVPISLVIALDLLDLGLDFLSTPIDWLILSRFNLQALRNVAVVEAIIPFTQPVPTLTIAWFAARALNMGQAPQAGVLETEEVGPGEYRLRTGRQ